MTEISGWRKRMRVVLSGAGALIALAGVTAPLESSHMTTIAVHHLLHAGLAFGAGLLALMMARSREDPERVGWVWPAIVAPALGLAFMWPSEYAWLMAHPWLHVLDHLSIALMAGLAVYASEAYWRGLGGLMLVLVVAMDAAAAGGFGVSRGPSFLLQAQPATISGAAAAEVAAKHQQPIRTLHTLGAQLYQTMGCSGCHSVNGAPGVGPTWKNLAGYPQKLANGQTAIADYQFLRTMILDPGKIDLAGFPQGVMPNTYRAMLTGKKHPHETRLNALIWYINTLSDRRSKASQPPVPDSLRQARFTTQAGG